MAVQTFSAHAVARDASKGPRKVTDKQVRGLARTTFARFDKTKHPAYQSHAYTAAERRTLLSVFAARASGRKVTAPKPRKVTRKARVSAPAAPSES